MFKEFFMIFALVLVHELGHLIAAILCKWNLKNITIYPFGGTIYFDDKLNRSIKEEVFILISGPVFQILFFFFLYFLSVKGFITYRNINLIKSYNYTLLIFNLLPIYPLDGGRLLNLFLDLFLPLKRSNKITIFISIVILFCSIYFYQSMNYILMVILIFSEILIYLKRQDFLYNRFLLERYMNKFNYNKFKVIKRKDLMYKDKRHIVFYNGKYITEKDYLNERFKVIR